MKIYSIFTLALSAALFWLPASAEDFDFPHLITTGYGEVSAKPDMAEFSVQIVESMATAEQAKKSVDNVVVAFIDNLTKQGVDKQNIISSNLYIAPQYHYPKDGKAELVGYRASRDISVTVKKLTDLNRYLDLALKSGINHVDNIQLKVQQPDKYQQQARLAAIKDAQNKAQSLAKGFGKKLKGVWQIDYNLSGHQPALMRSMADVRTKSNGYQDSTIVIRDKVRVMYKLND